MLKLDRYIHAIFMIKTGLKKDKNGLTLLAKIHKNRNK